MMTLLFTAMDRSAARAVLEWHYPPPYQMYDLTSPEDAAEGTVEFLTDPRNGYYRMDDEKRELVAFCCFGSDAQVPGGDYTRPALDIGLGVRPDLTGQGQGQRFVQAVIDYARQTLTPQTLRVTIAEFNRRAQRVWERAGFHYTQRFGRTLDAMPFVIMEKQA